VFSAVVTTAKGSRKKGKSAKRPAVAETRGGVPELAGRTILIIDDDIRNIYSLTSVLEAHNVTVLHAESGAEGIDILDNSATPIDVALVDIMMPEMDGYETMRRIRAGSNGKTLPLISVTAKAMKGDRQKCLDAGASDYISKPVDVDLLLALLRVWLGRADAERAAIDQSTRAA
jgi:CheY-like chemotaxis protein